MLKENYSFPNRFTFIFLSPQLINIQEAYRSSNRENLSRAFEFAHKHYGIMQLIDPEGK